MVKQIGTKDVLELRHRVLRPNQPIESCIYPLDEKASSGHFGFFLEGRIISIGSVYLETREGGGPASWRLRGMATAPEHQGKGFGAQVLQACLDYVKEQGGSELWCNARTTASGFYSAFGFRNLTPEPFDLPGIGPHYLLAYAVGE